MPPEFGYTGAILTNDEFQGLYHIILRHIDQWQEYIPGLNDLMETLPDNIVKLIQKIIKGKDKKETRILIDELINALKKLEPGDKDSYKSIMIRIQLKIYEFLKSNVTSVQYLEEGMNNNDQIQVYFKVTDINGNKNVMVVCVSKQLYPEINQFGDPRPVRTIITVYFRPWIEYLNSQIRIEKCWPRR